MRKRDLGIKCFTSQSKEDNFFESVPHPPFLPLKLLIFCNPLKQLFLYHFWGSGVERR